MSVSRAVDDDMEEGWAGVVWPVGMWGYERVEGGWAWKRLGRRATMITCIHAFERDLCMYVQILCMQVK